MKQPAGFTSVLISKFHRWHESGLCGEFVHYLKAELSGVHQSWVQRGNLRNSLVEAGINPDVHLRSRIDRKDVNARLQEIIIELAGLVGSDQLHDDAMNSTDLIPVPSGLRCSGNFPLSRQYGEQPRITRQALQRKLVASTGIAWAGILDLTGFSQCNRRIASRTFGQTVAMFVDLRSKSDGQWTKNSLRKDQRQVFKAAWNLARRMDSAGVPATIQEELCKDPIFTLWSLAEALTGCDSLDQAVTAFLGERVGFAETFYANRVSEFQWSPRQLRVWVLDRYASGLPLDRETLERDEDPRARSAAYWLRSRTHSNSGFDLEAHGVLLKRLQQKLGEIDSPYNAKQALERFQELVRQTLSTGTNCLSREWVERNDPTFARICLSRSKNDWSLVLTEHGLDPRTFSICASVRAKRGAVFQDTLREVFVDSGFVQTLDCESVVADNQFAYNRSISGCDHLKTGCRPDFVFRGLIVDAKVGSALAKPTQLVRYLDHRSTVVVVTANDKPKSVDLSNGSVRILGISDFIDQSESMLGRPLVQNALKRLTQSLTVRSATDRGTDTKWVQHRGRGDRRRSPQ